MAASLEGTIFLAHHLLRYGIIYFGIYLLGKSSYRILLHPLARYPGPVLARISPFWRTHAQYSKRAHLIYQDLHQTYGPVVRDGPNSLSFSDYHAIKVIYGRGKDSFSRPNTFPTIGINSEHPPIFFAVDAQTHQSARRKVGGAYTMTTILTMEDQIDKIVQQLEDRLDEEAANESYFDFSKWINYFTVDIISDLAFGESFGCLRTCIDANGIISGLQGGHVFAIILSVVPSLGTLFSGPLSKYLKPPDNQGIGLALKVAANIVSERYKQPSEKKDLLNAIISSKDPDRSPIHRDQVRGEVVAALVAGGDTTAMSILGCVGFLLRNPGVFSKLREEIDTAYSEGHLPQDQVPRYADLAKLPYLTAVINETLRFSPSVGAAFTRRTPEQGVEILPGYYVPGGTEVGVNNWVIGRSADLYGKDVEKFRPERWLEDDAKTKLMKDYEFAFGHGARICIGRNLAFVELFKTIAELVRRYDIIPRDLNRLWTEELKLFLYKSDMMVTVKRRHI
ncbi:cytochrome P450 [Eremomyces bilateralis CBS 781.70]|uniref:Cytochrome P450 n=1 Tax=Eremomyces bilateralis CBS 781.70 TaxID=1392243 RepID=A0A6G1FR44_9PEZI|nr:cytochrome P450 [Eremomyces bilateralis CBS 781.70]KAF1808151.1 cytochrome P450 [Eremomyces bilateralis CBS 781.70]